MRTYMPYFGINGAIMGMIPACIAITCATAASAQMTLDGDTFAIGDVRPLAKLAEYITGRYGIPVAYEDLPASAYSGGLPPPSTVRFRAFEMALRSASAWKIGVEGPPMESMYHARISANNEVAREVLVKILNGLHRVLGVHSVGEMDPEPTYTWDLTTDPSFDISILSFRRAGNVYRAPVIMEKAPGR
jgi:hypothetical protein